ncbi:MAG: hypothetical protein ACN4GZ_01470, partial [Acidimicrobiales bacterium]
MSVAPRALIVTRPTEYDEMLGRHGSRQQVAFFLEQRGQSLETLDERHALQLQAVQRVSAAIPVDWRRASLTRADLSRFVFGPEDAIIAVGQDGLVANVAKYLEGQPVIGVNPDPDRNPGVLALHAAADVAKLLKAIADGTVAAQTRAMVQITTDDGQGVRALNEVFVGHPRHQSARYTIEIEGQRENQSSSGLLIGTGTGSTGWCASVHRERALDWELPGTDSSDLAWFVREAWPSPWTGTTSTAGRLVAGELVIRCESDRLVAFGDGIESDYLELSWGQV